MKDKRGKDANPDPITGQPGSHPVGTGIGAAGAGATGAAIGAAVGGPIGAIVGGAVGAVAGGAAGHGVAESIDPTREDAYWRDNWKSRPYASGVRKYEDLQPAYRYGWESRSRASTASWDDKYERDLSKNWDSAKGSCPLNWNQAKPAIHDAWQRAGIYDTNSAREANVSSATGRQGRGKYDPR